MFSITVAIPTLNRTRYLIKTIDQVLLFNNTAVVEILIIDQTDIKDINPEEYKIIKDWQADAVINYQRSNVKSLTHSRNLVLKIAKGNIIVFLDDDLLLHENFFENHLRHYQNPDVIAVAGMVYQREDDFNDSEINHDNFLDKTFPSFDPKFSSPNYSWNNIMVGCNHSVLKTAAIKVRGYDENYPGYYEDSDFSYRLQRAKIGKIVYDKDAYVIHLRAPVGGCKISNTNVWKESNKVVGHLLFYFRFPEKGNFLDILRIVRVGPLRKENVLNIFKQPFAWYSFLKAIFIAFRMRNKVISPF